MTKGDAAFFDKLVLAIVPVTVASLQSAPERRLDDYIKVYSNSVCRIAYEILKTRSQLRRPKHGNRNDTK